MPAQSKTKSTKTVDLRKLPVDKRPKPTSGQSREAFTLPAEELTKWEVKLLGALNGKGKGLRETMSVGDLSKQTKLSLLETRNTLRRLVPSAWAERVAEVLTDEGETKPVRGHYRITANARRKLES